ncbi:ABC transporter related [Methylobacterium nodulans ORS 2060]|uniref:ABC transporter related n=1 Tax=Methylobacterium nodulans (strain LMG 21967 / CNCM I-2342 / ORS 2060) TaxID=460265 RepID=B8I9Y1_METNO|nr:ABC transporter related [Methylobacterium nodulans ORS 2060]
MLRVAGFSKRFGADVALSEVDFAVREGEILGLIGPNGSGKTTLLECLAGLLSTDHGSVTWRGEALPIRSRKTVLFYLPDGIAPFTDHRVANVLSFFGAAYQLPKDEINTTLAALGLAPVLGKRAGELSKGYRRRLLLAIGLLAPHPLLLFDEPFDGLDLHQTRDVMRHLRSVAARGRTLFLSIHQLTDAARVCDRFVLLSAGRVRGEGTLETLRATAGLASDAGLEEVFLALT